VDFKVMLTFLDFYETLIGFVNFKLFEEVASAHPPCLLIACCQIGIKYPLAPKALESRPVIAADKLPPTARPQIFQGFKFFLSRETPKFSLRFLILSHGGDAIVEAEADPNAAAGAQPGQLQEQDETITHQIVDRPAKALEGRRSASRKNPSSCLPHGADLAIACRGICAATVGVRLRQHWRSATC
jgi:pescadillo protein